MTQEIIEMARQAGYEEHQAKFDTRIEAFAKLVADKQSSLFYIQEQIAVKLACANAIAREREALTPRCWTAEMNDAWNKAIPDLTLAFDELIRARGEA
jgi:hypothetical protein